MSENTAQDSARATARRRNRRSLLAGCATLALLGASVYLTVALRDKQADDVPLPAVAAEAGGGGAPGTDRLVYERLSGPDRTVVRDGRGAVLATLTDGARTAVLTGPSRTFTEPKFTTAKVITDSWVRLLPEPWSKGAEKTRWFTDWFAKNQDSRSPDLLAFGRDYIDRAPQRKDEYGNVFAGDAKFGPLGPEGGDLRLEQSDFYDYLGRPYTFRDGTTEAAEAMRLRSIDCSGFVRMVYGYRARFPLAPSDTAGDGLPRTANGMARSEVGVPVLELTGERPRSLGKLQPGDLVFFEIDARTGDRLDHVGIYMGLDTEGNPRFLSSREEANGPTFGDKGGDARLDGNGFYATGLRSAKRL